MTMIVDMVDLASGWAIYAHGDQKRQYTGEPYWRHPERVAATVASVGGTIEQIAAAWLHDVVEDTDVTLAELRREFGDKVADYVFELTAPSKQFPEKSRALRKAMDRDFLSQVSPEAKTIKLADIIDNAPSLIQYSEFADVWVGEVRHLLPLLKNGGNATLWKQAASIIYPTMTPATRSA